MFAGINVAATQSTRQIRNFSRGSMLRAVKNTIEKKEKEESERMKKFHEKLKSGEDPGMRLDDLVPSETDPKSVEKDPTKWGDWQHGGRVSDF